MAILDGLSPTGAWSFSRDLLSSWASAPRYTDAGGGAISELFDQSGAARDMVQAVSGQRPLIATAGPNSRLCGNFDGTNDHLASTNLSDYITATSGYMVVSVMADAIAGNTSTPYNNDAVIADSGGYVGLFLRNLGSAPYRAIAYHYDGNSDISEQNNIELNIPFVLEWKHEGGQIYLRVNGETWTNAASGNTNNLNNVLRLGRRSVSYLDGKIFEAAVFSTIPSSGDQDAIAADMLAWVSGTLPVTSDVTIDYALQADAIESDIEFDYALETEGLEVDVTFDYKMFQDPIESDIEFDYKLLLLYESDITLDYEMEIVYEARVTQLPVLAVTVNDNTGARITQLPILAVALPEQNTRITQLPFNPVVHQKPVPLPSPIVPLSPISEVWSWLTVVNQMESSREQRSGLRETPRYRLSFDMHIDNDTHRRAVYNVLYKLQGREFDYPIYSSWSRLTERSLTSDDRLYFDPSHTDMRAGEKLAIFDVFSLETTVHEIDAMNDDGATLTSPVGRVVAQSHVVCPVIPFRLIEPYSLSMISTTGRSRIVLESTRKRVFKRATVSLPTIDNLPIIAGKPYNDADEAVNRGFEWLDTETSIPRALTAWQYGLVNGRRNYVFDRETQMDYWREVVAHMAGRRRAVRIPTFFDDLPLIIEPALGAMQLTTSNIQAAEFMRAGSYQAIVLWRRTGPAYRLITDRVINYDANGDPVSVTFKLSSSIGSNAGDNIIRGISFMYRMRLASDDIELIHDTGYSTISLDLQAVNE